MLSGESQRRHPRRCPVQPGRAAPTPRTVAAGLRSPPQRRGRTGRDPDPHRFRAERGQTPRHHAAQPCQVPLGRPTLDQMRTVRLMRWASVSLQPHTSRRPARSHEDTGATRAIPTSARPRTPPIAGTASSSTQPPPSTPPTARSSPAPSALSPDRRWLRSGLRRDGPRHDARRCRTAVQRHPHAAADPRARSHGSPIAAPPAAPRKPPTSPLRPT